MLLWVYKCIEKSMYVTGPVYTATAAAVRDTKKYRCIYTVFNKV